MIYYPLPLELLEFLEDEDSALFERTSFFVVFVRCGLLA